MTINRKLDFVILDIVESAARTIRTAPLNLGGLPGGGGGIGAPPGGYVGWLPQTRVAYDYDEIASSGIPASGVSLLDNLNHIRYRLNMLESGGSITIVDDNDAVSYYDTTKLHFSGAGVTVVDLGGGEVQVRIEATGSGGGAALIVQDVDGDPTVTNVDKIIFSGFGVQNLGSGDVLVSHSGSMLIVEEVDGSPTISNVDRIIFSGAMVYDIGGGEALVEISSSGLGLDYQYIPSEGWSPVLQTWTWASSDSPVYQIYVSGDVTSNSDYKLGNKIRCTQPVVGNRYGFIVKIGSYDSGNNRTPVDIYCGTDYSILNASINTPMISKIKSPDGFPLTPAKWTVTSTDTNTRTKTTPTDNTWYGETNAFDASASLPDIAIPIGVWNVTYNALVRGEVPAASSNFVRIEATLSTSGNSASDNDLVTANSFNAGGDGAGNLVSVVALRNYPKVLELTTKTTYYLLAKIDVAASPTSLQVQGAISTTAIRATCAYL